MSHPKWYEYAQKCTSPDEHILKNYEGKLDDNYGHLFLSDKKLLFIKEEGFFRKKYSAPFSLAFNKIEKIHPLNQYQLQIYEKTGKTHKFGYDSDISYVIKAIQEVMK